MYSITKRIELSGAHFLHLPYESKCEQLHGHNWIVDITIAGEQLVDHGMLMDFVHIKRVADLLDHKLILTEKQVEEFGLRSISEHGNPIAEIVARSYVAVPLLNTTAECIAEYIAMLVNASIDRDQHSTGKVTSVTVQESEGNVACFQPNIL